MLGASDRDFKQWPFGGRPATPCVYPGCTEFVPGGYHYCMPHLLAFEPKLKQMDASAMAKDKTLCIEPGCNAPRLLNKHGVPYSRCETHQKSMWNNRDQARGRVKTPKASPEPPPAAPVAVAVDDVLLSGSGDAPPDALRTQSLDATADAVNRIIHDALGLGLKGTASQAPDHNHPDAVRYKLTGLKVTINLEVEITL